MHDRRGSTGNLKKGQQNAYFLGLLSAEKTPLLSE